MNTFPAELLDAYDSRILAQLQRDARISMSELGRRVHLSQPAVTERVRKLELSGVIKGYHAVVDAALALNIQRTRRLVQQQDLGPLVQGPGQQDALLLPSRQRRAHVADERVVAHRHRLDLFVHRRHAGALLHPGHVGHRAEEADVVGDRA